MSTGPKPDFFISYNKADRQWAEWIARQLREAKYSVTIQDSDFGPGSNFVLEMDRAAREAERTIAVLSPDYLTALFTHPEWAAAFASDPTGKDRKLIPVRVRECQPEGLLAQIVYIDLVGHQDAVARRLLLAGVSQRTQAPPAATRVPGALPEIWNIPHARNPNFTGREQLLQELRASLTSGRTAAIVPIAGLGGAGKTQLALEYAYRHTADYDIVWWVRAEEPVTLIAGYAKLATELGLPEKDLADQQASAAAVLSWLGHHSGWLLILDNAPHPADCRDRLPPVATGHVLITSRDPNWGSVAKPLKLPVLPRAEAVDFLQKRCGRDEPAAAGELCGALGDLPLALEQAGAYIEATASSIADYIALYRSRPRELLNDAVAATWQISFERLQIEAPEALDLLYLTAFLAPDDIDPKLVSAAIPDAMRFNKAKAALLRYSLIDVAGGVIAVHRLVQAATRDRLANSGEEAKWAAAAVNLVNDAFPFKLAVVETWNPSARLLPHALAATGHSERLGVALESTSRLLNEAGQYLHNRGQLAEAGQALKRALAIAEKVYGPDHPNMASLANNIAAILKDQGDLPGALRYARHALAIDEKVYGPDHPEVATDANNIGTILHHQGDLAGALQYTRRALAIDEKVYGPDHPSVAIDANNIGTILQAQGDLPGALQYARRALAIGEKIYGPDHADVARAANNIGRILQDQGDLPGALQYTQRALAIDEKVYGPDHPNMARNANNIGQILQAQGDLPGALQHTRRALAIDERVYGADHPNVATLANNIGGILKAQGDMAGALQYVRRALAIDEKVYGPDHPNVARDANNIGQILQAQGDLPGALQHTRRALAIDEKVYGPDHPKVAIRASNIGRILQDQDDLAGALPYLQRALRILQATYGPDNPRTKTVSENLAILQQELAERGGGTP
jgi:tetratricopeptide (TPR) repeat protein